MTDLVGTVTWVEQPGLLGVVGQAGYQIRHIDGLTWTDNPTAVQALINSYSAVPWYQRQQVAAIEAKLASVVAAGFTYSGVLVAIDDASQAKINAMASQAMATIQAAALGVTVQAWPTTFGWLPQGAGAPLSLSTPQAMVQFGNAVAHYVSAIIVYADTLIGQVMAQTTVTGVQGVNINTGWPTS